MCCKKVREREEVWGELDLGWVLKKLVGVVGNFPFLF